ncbi:glycogen debranching N-terminal domain-containing protein [Streptomyces sp. NPDC051940]|uniref:amylo-alpha-1,6-glucosidase n=1 Tax=Streptomyces sp. NPDC051940 TaxID=3155675 RepID=UPI003435AC7E
MPGTDHSLLFHGETFAVLNPAGDITGARGALPEGLFVRDARHLSRWQLTVDGATPDVLAPGVLVPHVGRSEPPPHTVAREQQVRADGVLEDRIRVVGNRAEQETVRLALTVDADFTDLFELRSDHRWYEKAHAVRTREVHPDGVEFGYRRREWRSATVITASPAPDAVEETGSGARRLVWLLELPPHGTAELLLRVEARPYDAPDHTVLPTPDDEVPLRAGEAVWPELRRACEQGLADLSRLLIPAQGPEGEALRIPAAGVPWFLSLLARHALITSLFALPYRPSLAAATLPALAATQATETDRTRGAQPGKIVHEVRNGELAHFEQVPYGRYYGSVDSTPLFLMLLGAYTDATHDDKPARRLERHARSAVTWMLEHGGLEDRGYLVYRADEGGLANQSWKDSPGAVCFASGERARGAIAAAAPQGYAYAALRAVAALARTVWEDGTYADRLDGLAADLRERFVRDFWLPAEDFPALALDGSGTRVDALASDAGHLLWCGLLDEERGVRVGRRLLKSDFFSGWGIRTLATGQPAYHPLSYHRGSVWPHDSAIAALGLARYGLRDEAATLARALTSLAEHTAYRLPELTAGYARPDHPDPVPYPHACSPQSWAAAAPLALVSAVTGPAPA